MADKINMGKSTVRFLTKKEFIDRKSYEYFSVQPNVEEKLKQFNDEDILAVDISINSPAIVTDIQKIENVVDFMNQRFSKEGLTKQEISKSFEF